MPTQPAIESTQKSWLHSLFRSSEIGVLVLKPDHHIITLNTCAERIFGFDKTELVGKNANILFHAGLPEKNEENEVSWLTIKHRNGTKIPLEVFKKVSGSGKKARTLLFLSGKPSVPIFPSEIQKNNRWLTFLNEAVHRLTKIENIDDGLQEILNTTNKILGTKLGNVQLLDPKSATLRIACQTGFSSEFLYYFRAVSTKSNSVCGVAFEQRKQIVVQDVHNEPFFKSHVEIAEKSGFLSVQSTPMYDPDGAPIGMISNHAPEKKFFGEEELNWLQTYARYAESFIYRIQSGQIIQQLNEELEQKVLKRTQELTASLEREKLGNQKKSQYVSIASHEFRTPLSAIITSASLAGKYTEGTQQKKRERHLNRIIRSVKALTEILDDFLSLDKLEQGKITANRQEFNVKLCLEEWVENVKLLCKPEQNIHLSFTGRPNVTLDKKILRNIVLNLLSNGVKYSEQDVEIQVISEASKFYLRITDKGIGIPEEEQKQLFSTFFRASNTNGIKGTGLGLNIVKKYVELLDGTISFQSEENVETSFTVVLPMQKAKLNIKRKSIRKKSALA